jgi:DNA invertase Pin-like site-specific DNA recombinase
MQKQRRYQPRPKKQEPLLRWGEIDLPLLENVGIYARQSTVMQVRTKTNSGEMQTDDLIAFAYRLGWAEGQIILYAENRREDGSLKHASGTLRIDQREGLRALVERIERDEIKAVIVFLEDRLFRDETGIQYNTFIKICKEHNCFVITPHMTYDFHNRYHVKIFRDKCEQAADYLSEYITLRLHGARERAARKGFYDGRTISVGFIVDRRATVLVDGQEATNPTYKKVIPYEPHAKVVRSIFKRFALLGGRFLELWRELSQIPVLFPEFDATVDPRTKARFGLRKVNGGYHLSPSGLMLLLTNVIYIGWWMVQGEIVSKNNHPAIVEDDVFWLVFYKLSGYTPEGEEIKAGRSPVRYHRMGGKPPIALLKGVIGTEFSGDTVYVVPGREKWCYGVCAMKNAIPQYTTTVTVDDIDNLFVDKLLEHMDETTDFSFYQQAADQIQAEIDAECVGISSQLALIEDQCQGLRLSLRKKDLKPEVREALEEDLAVLLQQRKLLTEKLNPEQKLRKIEVLRGYNDLVEACAEHWDKLSVEGRIALIDALTHKVLLDRVAPHFLRLAIHWIHPAWQADTAFVFRVDGEREIWTDAENEIIGEHYPTAAYEALLEKLPNRSWNGIKRQAERLGVHRAQRGGKYTTFPKGLSLQDWQFMNEHDIAVSQIQCQEGEETPILKRPIWSARHTSSHGHSEYA